ncbi:DNA-directed RNA polymerase I core subunit rpa12 [Tulasnella sp. 419]|nr:DNA-directed RNA polymerase I core subunit rpa12 [Tulasnella sp. 418]KAG8958209.1 DNA-directed RNA polymerase I core subunit rpa12 [Tulasnella sp. 419]
MPLAHRIGSLLFCPDCGTLLDIPTDDDNVKCEQCGHLEPASSFENIEVTTRSHPDAFPSALRDARKIQTQQHDTNVVQTEEDETCPKCQHPRALAKAMQTRSADEGATIFYTCLGCSHGWVVYN